MKVVWVVVAYFGFVLVIVVVMLHQKSTPKTNLREDSKDNCS